MTVEDFFAGQAFSKLLFEAVQHAIETIGPAELRFSKSQVSFKRRTVFALVWMPEQYLRRKAAPLVLTIALRRRDASQRWKEIVEPHSGRFTHHLEIYSPAEVDDQVLEWLREAWMGAG